MRAHIAGGAGDQHIAEVIHRRVPERFHGIFRKQFVDSGIIIVVEVEEPAGFADLSVLEQLRQGAGRGILEDVAVGDLISLFRGGEHHRGDDERGAADLKEIIRGSHAVQLQRVLECLAEEFLRGVGRRDILSQTDGHRIGQAPDIGLSVRGHGHLVELEIGGGHHIVGQMLFKLVSQPVDVDLGIGGEVGAEVILAAELADADRRLSDVGLGGDEALDLAQLDPEAPELDLVVQSAKDMDVAVAIPFGVVAGAVHPCAAVFHKRLGGLLGEILVAPGHADAADVQLADHAEGRGIAELVHDDLVIIQQRPADGHGIRMGQIRGVAGDRDLRRAVGVDDPNILRAGPDRVAQRHRIALAARHHQLAPGKGVSEGFKVHILLEARGRGVEAVHVILLHQPGQGARVVHLVFGGKHQGLSVAERRGMLLEGHIEGHGRDGKIGGDVFPDIVHVYVRGMGHEIVADALVPQHDALGLAGGAGGIDHVAERFIGHFHIGVFNLIAVQQLRNLDGLPGGIIPKLIPCGDDEGSLRILNDVVDPVRGILGVAGNEGRARLVHAEQAGEEAAFPGQEQGHAVAGFDAPGDQIVGDDIRPFIQFAVSQRRVPGDQRGLLRVRLRAALEEPVQQGLGKLRRRRGAEGVKLRLLVLRQGQRIADRPGVCAEAAQRVPELTDEVINDGILEQLGGILHHEVQPLLALSYHDADVAAHLLQRGVELHAQAVLIVGRRVPHEIHADIEDGIAGLIALSDKFADHILKGQIRAIGHAAHGAADRLQIVADGQIALRLHAHGRCVDEHADDIVRVLRTHVGGDAEYHILGRGIFAQHHGNCGENELKFRYAEAPRGVVQRFELFIVIIKYDLPVGEGMDLGPLAPDGHFIHGNAVREQLVIESHAALVFFVQAVIIQIGEVDLRGGDLEALQGVDQLPGEGLGGAAVKGDVMDRHVQYDAAVGNRVQRRTDGYPRVEIKGHGIAVDDRNDLFTGSGRLFHDLRQLVGQYAHRKAVFLSIIGSERLVGLKDGIEGLLHRFQI